MHSFTMRRKEEVFMNSDCGNIIRQTVKKNVLLAVGIVIAVCGAVVISLLPPLVLAKMIDAMTQKQNVGFTFVALYFGLTALTGVMEASREGFLTVFGQKITHALRSSLMEKFTRLTADSLNKQEPGALVSRFVGDVDTVENLFTSGIISMFADACRIISILAVIWFQNKGLKVFRQGIFYLCLFYCRFCSGLHDMSRKIC